MITKEDIIKIQEKIMRYRGVVVHDFINIESMIGSIISIYFAKDNKNNEFNRKVIDDEYFSFGLKVKILEKLKFKVYKTFFEDTRRIGNIRNLFSHQVPTLEEGFFIYNADKESSNHIKMAELYKEFRDKYSKIDEQLNIIFNELVNIKK